MYNKEDLETCYQIIKEGSHSFYAASQILPKKVRDSAIVLYSFCRIVDDAIDDSQTKLLSLKSSFSDLKKSIWGNPKITPPIDVLQNLLGFMKCQRHFRWLY